MKRKWKKENNFVVGQKKIRKKILKKSSLVVVLKDIGYEKCSHIGKYDMLYVTYILYFMHRTYPVNARKTDHNFGCDLISY